MEASSFFSSGPPQQQQQRQQRQSGGDRAQFYGGRASSMESVNSEEFETLDINDNNHANNGGNDAANFFDNAAQQPTTTAAATSSSSYTATSAGENFSTSAAAQPVEYEGVALQTALNTFSTVANIGGGLVGGVTNSVRSQLQFAGANRQFGGANYSGNNNTNNNVAKASSAASTLAVTRGAAKSVFQGIGSFASSVVGTLGEDDEIAGAMARWAEEQRLAKQKEIIQGQQGQQGQQQQGYGNNVTAQQLFSAPSPSNTPQFGAMQTTNTTTSSATTANVGPPALSLGAAATTSNAGNHAVSQQVVMDSQVGGYSHSHQPPVQQQQQQQQQQYPTEHQYPTTTNTATTTQPPHQTTTVASEKISETSAAHVFGGGAVTTTNGNNVGGFTADNATAADVFGATSVAVKSENASAADVFGANNNASISENATAADVFGATNAAVSENSSAADVFGSTNATSSENATATDVFGGANANSTGTSAADVFGSTNAAVSTENATAADVFGATNAFSTENTTAADVFGATNAISTENSSAADVFGSTNVSSSENASAADVFGAVSDNATAADVLGGAENVSATDVFESSTSNPTSATESTTAAADVFSGTAYPVTTAEEVFGGDEIPTTVENINEPLLPDGWVKGIDESSGNAYYYNTLTGESSWNLPEKTSNATTSTEINAAAENVAVVTQNTTEEAYHKALPEVVHRQSSNQLSSLECAEQDPNFQYSDPLVGSAVEPATTTGANAMGVYPSGVAKPPVTGNVLAMEIGNYHPPTAMMTMMDQQQDVNVSAGDDVTPVEEKIAKPKEPVEVTDLAEKEEAKEVEDATPETTTVQQQTPPLAASSNVSTIAASSTPESTEKHTIASSLAPEKRPTVTTNNAHRRFQLNLPKKAALPLPPPRSKKTSSSISGGGSLGSSPRKKKFASSPFRKPPPMEVSATPRFHVPPPAAGGSSVCSGGSGHHHYPLPKSTTPGATSVSTTSPLPTPRVLDDGEDAGVPPSSSPLLPAASTAAMVEAAVETVDKIEPDVTRNVSTDAPVVSDEEEKVLTEEPEVETSSIVTENAPPVAFQPLELEQIVEAVAAPTEEFKMELPKKKEEVEVNYTVGEDTMKNPPPTYSLTTRPIYHKDEIPRAESSLFTEGGGSDYQASLRDEDLPPMSDSNEQDGVVLPSVENGALPAQIESENIDTALNTPAEDKGRDLSGEVMVSSSVATEYPMSDYQEQVQEEDFVVVESSDFDNNVVLSTDMAPASSSPWVETVDPASGKTYYYNQESGETSWQLPAESVGNNSVAAVNEEAVEMMVETSPEESSMAANIVEESESLPTGGASEPTAIPSDEVVVEPEVTEVPTTKESVEAPILPEGWVTGVDETSGNTYYYNTVTGESSWDLPSADTSNPEVNVEEKPKAEIEHEEDEPVIVEEMAEVVTDRYDSPTEDQVEEESDAVAQESEPPEVGPLPVGWIEANDPSGRVFYFNSSTGQSSWERPKIAISEVPAEDLVPAVADGTAKSDVDKPVDSSEEETIDESAKADDAQVQLENLMVDAEESTPLEDDEDNLSFESLPPGWIETKDADSGQIYYYNEQTGESSWSKPAAILDTVDDTAVPNAASEGKSESRDELGGMQEASEDSTSIDGIDDGSDSVSEEPEPMEKPHKSQNVDSESELPRGWIEAVHEGNTYYYNEETGETSWSKPIVEIANDRDVSKDSVPVPEESPELTSTVQVEDDASPESNTVALDLRESHVNEVTEEPPAEDETVEQPISAEKVDALDELPPGWSSSVDETTGNTFYYNEETGESTWEKPSTEVTNSKDVDEESVEDAASVESEVADATDMADEPMEQQPVVDEVMEEHEQVVETASESVDATQDNELPPGWSSSVDDATGNTFYYNEETGESTWEKPVIVENPDALSPEEERLNGDIAVAETEVPEVENTDDEAAFVENAATAEELMSDELTDDTATLEERLPSGWSSSVDEASGKTFYYNEETGESTWEKPTVDESPEDEDEVDEVAVAETEAVEHDSDAQQLQPEEAVVADVDDSEIPQEQALEEEIYVTSAPEREGELPPNWSSSVDETTGNTFYYNEQTGESTWEKPTMTVSPDESSPKEEVPVDDVAAVEVEAESEVEHDANLQHLQAGEATSDEAAAVEKAETTDEPAPVEEIDATSASQGEGELPPGWASSIDEISGNTFYYNEETGESTWEKPTMKESPDEPSSKEEVPIDDVAVAEIAESETLEDDVNSQQQQEDDEVLEDHAPVEETVPFSSDESDDLPPGWSSSLDESSGKIFYYNEEGLSSWEKPSIEKAGNLAEPEDETSVDGASESQEGVEDGPDGSSEPHAGKVGVNLDEKEKPQTDGLPVGWKELQDEATGKTYYWNEETNETSWDCPRVASDADAVDLRTEEEDDVREESLPEDNPNDADDDLPEGWMATVDETSGNTYYYNEKTNATSWDKPVAETKSQLPPPDTLKPANRCRPAHAIATFGFGGRLCVMMPQVAASLSGTVTQSASSDRPTMRRGPVVIHRVKDLIPRGHKFSIPSSVDSAVGPLVKAKEKDVLSFLGQKSSSPENLIWNVINIAAQNRGRLKNSDDVVGGGPEAAIVDLLLSVEKNGKSTHPNAPAVQATDSDLNSVQNLLLRGDRERAVIESLREKNYALALIIASMCDEDTYQMVARQFADDVLSAGSPLYTSTLLFTDNLQLPSNHELRDPKHGLSFWCEDSYRDLDTNWRQQLATLLSNKRGNYAKIIITLGDRLMQLGHCHAAHVCYLATSLSLNDPSKPSTRISLLGCDHNIPLNRALMTSESIEAFERSEAFEWARRLGNKKTLFSSLQPFKLRYAELLADVGNEALAREYLLSIRICSGIGMVTKRKGNPGSMYDKSFIQALREVDDRICGSIGAERSCWDANEESSKGSLFLGRLGALVRGKETEKEEIVTPRPESEMDPLLELDATTSNATQPQQEVDLPPIIPKSEKEAKEPPMQTNASFGSNDASKQPSTVDDVAPASAPPSLAIGENVMDRREEEKLSEEKLSEKFATPKEIKKDGKKKAPASEPPVSAGFMARLFGRDKESKAKVADMGEEMEAYFDEKLKTWIFPGQDPAEVAKPLAPPPIIKSSDKAPSTPAPAASNDPLAALMAPPTRATTARKGLPPAMARYADPLAPMGNTSTPGAATKKDLMAAPPKFAVFQPSPVKSEASKEEKENVAAT